jgi:curved DNA-binding protein CbpA
MTDDLDPYEVLEISPSASLQEVREAHLRMRTTYTRDNPALYSMVSPEERDVTLKKIDAAYSILSDLEKRTEHDNRVVVMISSSSTSGSTSGSASGATSSGGAHSFLDDTVVSIDRVPPMEAAPEGDALLIPPKTDFQNFQDLPESTVQPEVPPTTPPTTHQTIEAETEWRGSFIRSIRDARQVSLEEMAAITKISKTYLLAIEEEKYTKLPAPVYVRGFLTQIARILKLPADQLVPAYLARFKSSRPDL